MILYLHFDGVLHHYDVILDGRNRAVLLGMGTLFEYASRLEQILEPYPRVRIVLSSTWVRKKGFHYARQRLPPALRERVAGATWHTRFARTPDLANWWINEATRYEQIMFDVERRQPADWLAIDDDPRGWPADAGRHLVACDPMLGLGDPSVRLQLEHRLAHRMNRSDCSGE